MDEQHDSAEPTSSPAAPQYASPASEILPPMKPKRILKGLLTVLLVVILIAAIAGGAFWYLNKNKSTKTVSTPKSATATSQSTAVTKITAATKHYDSGNYNLGFDYPNDWTVNDTSDKLTVTSPAVQLKDASSQSLPAQIVLTIQNKQTSITQFAANKAVAALESQKIAYKKPTPNQRAQTYLSFVSYSGATTTFDAIYVAGDNGYQAGQSIPQSDVIQADPLVTISFLKCSDAACKTTSATAASLPATDWADSGLSKPLITLLQSLTIE